MNNKLKVFLLSLSAVFYLLIAWLVFDPSSNPNSIIFKLYLFGTPLVACALITLTRKDPIEFVLLVIIFLLPLIGMTIPPTRYSMSFLKIISLGLALLIFYRKLSRRENIDIVPYKYMLAPIFFIIPSVVLSGEAIISTIRFLGITGYYIVFIGFNHYLKKDGWPEKLINGLIFSLLIASALIIFERVTGIAPSLSHHAREVGNLGGVLILRSSGIFQDPQKAAQFVAVLSVFVLVLVCRKSIVTPKMKKLCILTLLISFPALILTITRASIYSAAFFGGLSLLFLNRFSLPGKVFLWLGVGLIAGILSLNSFQTLLPKSLATRMGKSQQSAEGRIQIWKDTWYIFKAEPVTGVGPGAYQNYLIKTDPQMKRLAQLGLAKRVPTMPENGYLTILYETGVIGSIGFIIAFFAILGKSFKLLLYNRDEHMKSFIYASLTAGCVYMSGFLTIYTASDTRNALLAYLLALVIINSKKFIKRTIKIE